MGILYPCKRNERVSLSRSVLSRELSYVVFKDDFHECECVLKSIHLPEKKKQYLEFSKCNFIHITFNPDTNYFVIMYRPGR